MQAPTLFIIAADLTKMQVNANIDEADVGRIRPDQTVTFRVDAYPTRRLPGHGRADPAAAGRRAERDDLRHDHQRAEPELKLKPGMTANLKVEIAQAQRRRCACRTPRCGSVRRPTCSRRSTSRCRPRRSLAAAADAAARRGGRAAASATRRDAGSGAPARSAPPARRRRRRHRRRAVGRGASGGQRRSGRRPTRRRRGPAGAHDGALQERCRPTSRSSSSRG